MFYQNPHWERCLYVLPKLSMGKMFLCCTKTVNVSPKPSMGKMFVCFNKSHIGADVCMFYQNTQWERCLYVLPKPSMGRMFVCSPKPSLRKMIVGPCWRSFSAVFSARGATILTAWESIDHTAKLWSTESGDCLITLDGQEGEVCSAVLSAHGAAVLTASHKRTAKLWSTESDVEHRKR